MTNKFLAVLVFLISQTTIYAQNNPAIQTDRPDQTECPFIVPANHFQVESGFSYEKVTTNSSAYALPSTLIRYGVNEMFEFRLIEEFVAEEIYKETSTGFTPLTFGLKAKLNEEKGIFPEMAFIGHLSIPDFASEDYKTVYYAPSFRLTMQHTLSEKVTLAYNLGAEWDGFSAEPTFIYTLTSGITTGKNTGIYFEFYGFAPQNQNADHRFDGGFVYQMKPNMQFDISGGVGITENAPDYYGALGFSFRLPD